MDETVIDQDERGRGAGVDAGAHEAAVFVSGVAADHDIPLAPAIRQAVMAWATTCGDPVPDPALPARRCIPAVDRGSDGTDHHVVVGLDACTRSIFVFIDGRFVSV